MGLQKRASLFSGLGLFFLVGILVFIGFWAVQEITSRSFSERVSVAQMVARGVDQTLQGAENQLEKTAVDIDIDNNLGGSLQVLSNLYNYSGTFARLFLVDSNGTVLAVEPPSLGDAAQGLIDSDNGVSEVLQGAPPTITTVSTEPGHADPLLSISVPVQDKDGLVTGAIVGHVELSGILGTYIQPLDLGKTAFTEIVSEYGTVMASSKKTVDNSSEETDYAAHFAALIQQDEASLETCYRCHDTGKATIRTRDLLAFAPLTMVSGGVAIRQERSEALAPRNRLLQYLFLAGTPLLLLGIAFTWLSTRSLIKPVLELTRASGRIADGDLDVPITVDRSDELGLLARTFDRMRLGLKESMSQKEERAVESEGRAQHLAVLNVIAATVGRSLDLEKILADSLEQVVQRLPFEAGYIFLSEADSGGLQLKASSKQNGKWLELVRHLEHEIGDTTETISFEDAFDGKAVTFVTVPLISKDVKLGVIWLVSLGNLTFTTEEIELLDSIGHQVGVAIDNVRLFQGSERKESETRALYRLGVEISRLLDLDRIMTTVVDSALSLSGADGTLLAVNDESSGEVYIQALSGSLGQEYKNLRLQTQKPNLINEVLDQGQARFTLDYLNDPELGHSPEIDALFRSGGFKSCLAVPLKIGERVSGVLMAVYRQKYGFDSRETELLQQFANQAAVALENARLHNQVQELAIVEERTRLSREMHDSLGQVLGYLGLQIDENVMLLSDGQVEKSVKKLEDMRKVVNSASDDVRHLILALRTPGNTAVEMPSILREYLDSFQSQTGIEVRLNVRNEEATRFSTKVGLQLMRVVQEALSNVRKHARAKQVEVTFDIEGDEAVVTIEDNGEGFEPSQVYDRGQHFGLQVMEERMSGLGGTLKIDSAPGSGTRVVARLPLEEVNG